MCTHHFIITNNIGKCKYCPKEKDFSPKKSKLTRDRLSAALDFEYFISEPYELNDEISKLVEGRFQ